MSDCPPQPQNNGTAASAGIDLPGGLILMPQHLADLRKSGLSDDAIRAGGFFTTYGHRARELLAWGDKQDSLGHCLAIPYRDAEGHPVPLLGADGKPVVSSDGKPLQYTRLKADNPRKVKSGKDKGRAIKYESRIGAPVLPYFPPGTLAALKDPSQLLLITEGEKKAAKADQEGFPCIGLGGVECWSRPRPKGKGGRAQGKRELIAELAAIPWEGRPVAIAYDSDLAEKRDVQWAEWSLAEALRERGALVKVARLPAGEPGEDGEPVKVGLDDFLVVRGPDALRAILAAAVDPVRPDESGESRKSSRGRPKIVISTEEYEVNETAAAALARDASLYQRGGVLARVVRDTSPAAGGIRRPFAPRIEPLPPALLRERLTACAYWVVIRETKEGPVEVPAHPPAWSVSAVHSRADWPGVRHLEAVVDYPVLRPDGTILDRPGYDPDSGLLIELAGEPLGLPESPARADALGAVAQLLEVVHDFPFASPCHQAAWLAALLTPLARFAFAGPAPLFLVDANVRAAGKGLLLDCISRILTGERFTVATYTSDEDELRKRITALALAGDRLVLFDNLEGHFGNAVLDAALTATSWEDRILGVNRMARAPLFVTWYATGNNVAVHADTSRRVCHIRLESPEERPEERSEFRHSDLLAWVGEHRPRLLAAALTILRAYFVAGRPRQELTPWGSFDGWSRLVRSAVVWAGLPDPRATCQLLQDTADVPAESMSLLLACWERMDEDRQGMTAAEVIDRLYKNKNPLTAAPDWHGDMRAAVEALVGKADSRLLGNRLRSYRRRVFQGRFIDKAGQQQRATRWAVYPAGRFRDGVNKTHKTHLTHTPGGPPAPSDGAESGESSESCESASANAESGRCEEFETI
jgi:hypothetical protein